MEKLILLGNISKQLVAQRAGGIYVRIAYVGIDYTLVALWQERTFGYGHSSYSCFVDTEKCKPACTFNMEAQSDQAFP